MIMIIHVWGDYLIVECKFNMGLENLRIETSDKGAFCEGWGNTRYLISQVLHYNEINIIE